ncbi:helix-turn-helix domain-containing protein [Salinirubellus sp. GCM10025818]|uniref:helix-turn-helix domain-containing protein n=1 Tax=Salinirubellus TaxID=2162630 RepID=UPI0030CD9D68
MSQSTIDGGSAPTRTSQLALRIWHPDCWTLETTARVDAGLVVRGVYHTDGITRARCTTYADSRADIEDLIAAITDTSLTDTVYRLHEYASPGAGRNTAAGNTTEELLVEYRTANSIHDAFVERGFVPEEPIRIHGGEEYWTTVIAEDRSTIRDHLDEIRRETSAEISVEGMKSPDARTNRTTPTARLSERQREVFRLAQREGYYAWPRDVSADDLATDLGLSKTTVLEHLRKAEAKLLGSL